MLSDPALHFQHDLTVAAHPTAKCIFIRGSISACIPQLCSLLIKALAMDQSCIGKGTRESGDMFCAIIEGYLLEAS